jgi:hypothetical protein
MQEVLGRWGAQAENLGSHSMRKGSTTFASSGSTACPSAAAICLRAGWSMPGVQSTYIRYEAAGDQFVGRTVAGLPLDNPNFATLPPFFENGAEDPLVAQALRIHFPDLPPGLARIAEFTLASLVYHSDYLRRVMHPRHRVFTAPLFADPGMLPGLKGLVRVRTPVPGDPIQATGIPPHISILAELRGVMGEIRAIPPSLEGMSEHMMQGLIRELENRALQANALTPAQFHAGVREAFNNMGLQGLVDFARRVEQGQLQEMLAGPHAVAAAPPPAGPVQPPGLYLWGGRMHRVPEDFTFPDCVPRIAWQHWVCGNATLGHPPYRRLEALDMPDKDRRRRRCDFQALMRLVERGVHETDGWIDDPTLEQANAMFELGARFLETPEITPRERERRRNQLCWRTVVNILRKPGNALFAGRAQGALGPGGEEGDA